MKSPELRQDPVSGDWILVAPGRSKRPHAALGGRPKRKKTAKKNCPFENPGKAGNKKPFLIYGTAGGDWEVQVFENKYPALYHKNNCAVTFKTGPFSVTGGVGHQDLVVTRDHDKNFARLAPRAGDLVFRAFQERYRQLAEDKCTAYVSVFHNWGPSAGASIYHPHYQIIALPIIPPDVAHSLRGSEKFFEKNRKCVHCEMMNWERKEKKRIIFENKGAVAFAPFVSRLPFEVRIFPKNHSPFFEDAPEKEISFVREALQKSLASIEKKLKDPDYNFFIHTSPISGKKNHKHYHWHLEVLPKLAIPAGFELATEVDINIVDPDEAAKILRGK